MAEQKKFIEAFGALKGLVDVRDYKLQTPPTAQVFPEEFELKLCTIKNQGSVGSCVAHAIAETVEYHNKIQDNITDAVSVGFIYGNRRNSVHKGSGMYVRDALANLIKYGDAFLDDFRENKEVPEAIELFEARFDSLKDKAYENRATKYFKVKSETDIKYALMNYGPVVFAMNWYSDIKVDANGLISTEQKPWTVKGGHCMVIYGWNKDGWKIQNSWGSSWGKKGCAVLPYDIILSESWGVTDKVAGDDRIKEPFKSKFNKWLVKILNWLLNLFKKKEKEN